MTLGGRAVTDEGDYNKFLFGTVIYGFWKIFGNLSKRDGISKDFAIQILRDQHEPWWGEGDSSWKYHQVHKAPRPDLTPECFVDRVLALCGCDVTHTYLGLSFLDLMQLDYATFTEIEEKVGAITEAMVKHAPDPNASSPRNPRAPNRKPRR